MDKSISYSRNIEYLACEYDIVVCGGGPSGTAAAIAAARRGAKTLLIESQGQLGGMATSGLVSHWLGGRKNDCETWVVGGIFKELSLKAEQLGFAKVPKLPDNNALSPHGWGRGQLAAGIPFDPYKMSAFLDDVVKEAGVDTLLLTNFVDAVVEDEQLKSVIIHNKSGLQAVAGKLFIDATGDADVASRSGCAFIKGREEDGLTAPSTVEIHVDNVDTDIFSKYIHENHSTRFLKEISQWTNDGEWPFDYDRFISVQLDRDDAFMINTSRLCGVDGTNGLSISDGMARGRKENLRLLEIMKDKIPGFNNARLKAMGTLLGVRETRRIVGEYVLEVQDLCDGKDFDDVIGFSSYGWDLPDPKKPSLQPMDDKNIRIKSNRTPLPFGIMRPKPITNLLCPGRAVSVERDVLGPVRVMAPCMAMGEAAGVAASISMKHKDFNQTDILELKTILMEAGAILD